MTNTTVKEETSSAVNVEEIGDLRAAKEKDGQSETGKKRTIMVNYR